MVLLPAYRVVQRFRCKRAAPRPPPIAGREPGAINYPKITNYSVTKRRKLLKQ
jgi:hypothetical protein